MALKAPTTFCLFFMVVSIMDLRMAKFSAAFNTLNCPDIFCLTLRFRIALSEPLLSGGTSG